MLEVEPTAKWITRVLTLLLLVSFMSTIAAPLPAKAADFWSNTGSEVVASFEHTLWMRGARPSGSDARWEAEQLSWYMAGPLQRSNPIAGPKHDQKIEILSIEPLDESRWAVRFLYTGTFIVESSNVENFRITLPFDRKAIYRDAQIGGRNPCTDSIYSTETYFWYFWSPDRVGCPLREGVHYGVSKANVSSVIRPEGPTYPEYARLVNPNGEIKMTLLFGADKDENGKIDPMLKKSFGRWANNDYNAGNYRDIREKLVKAGFTGRLVPMSELGAECRRSLPIGQTLTEWQRNDSRSTLKVRLFWGITSTHEENMPYLCLLDSALANDSLAIYNGHSNLGATANLPWLRSRTGLALEFNRSQYQLLAFNGCSSYGYYNFDFFKEKSGPGDPAGTRQMDIITNGIAGDFYDLGKMTWSVVDAVLDWSATGEATSYQTIINRMKTRYLTAVNGDEDNPRP